MNTNYQLNAMNVGGYVSSEHFDKVTTAYQEQYPGSVNFVTVKKEIILNVLNSHEWVSGIRFMYGLDDPMNPNSLRVFLIPCTHTSENVSLSKPLVTKTGYYDNTGLLNSLNDVVNAIAAYVKQMTKRNTDLVYKQVTRGNFLGKNSLLDLTSKENDEFISIHFGLENLVLKPVFVPSDFNGRILRGDFMNMTQPCPDHCNDDPGLCVAELSVLRFSIEEELNVFRNFRDNILLNLENGEELFEMYYFISPLIAALINDSSSKEFELKNIYFQKIVPFKELLISNKYEEANYLLNETFKEWVDQWQVSLNYH
jgi:hypothetical protein